MNHPIKTLPNGDFAVVGDELGMVRPTFASMVPSEPVQVLVLERDQLRSRAFHGFLGMDLASQPDRTEVMLLSGDEAVVIGEEHHGTEQLQRIANELQARQLHVVPGPREHDQVVDNLRDPHRPKHGARHYPQLGGVASAIGVIASTTPRVAGGALSAASVDERRAKQAAKLARRAAAAKKGQDHG